MFIVDKIVGLVPTVLEYVKNLRDKVKLSSFKVIAAALVVGSLLGYGNHLLVTKNPQKQELIAIKARLADLPACKKLEQEINALPVRRKMSRSSLISRYRGDLKTASQCLAEIKSVSPEK